ncbi:MAG: hypothetical protein ACE5IR_27595 [bacterium]
MRRTIFFLLCFAVIAFMGCQQEATVDDVVAEMTAALGGDKALSELMDRVENWDFTMHQLPAEMGGGKAEEGGMTSPMVITCKKGNKLRFDMQGPDGSAYMSMAYDGTKAWNMQMGGQSQDMSEDEQQEWASMASTWVDVFRNYADKGFTLELLENETIDGQEYIVMQSTDQFGNVAKNYINPSTYLLERAVAEGKNMSTNEKEELTMTIDDYKEVDGVMLAHHVAQFDSKGEMIWESTMNSAETNTGVADSFFSTATVSVK